jgi:hypothetical protein
VCLSVQACTVAEQITSTKHDLLLVNMLSPTEKAFSHVPEQTVLVGPATSAQSCTIVNQLYITMFDDRRSVCSQQVAGGAQKLRIARIAQAPGSLVCPSDSCVASQ